MAKLSNNWLNEAVKELQVPLSEILAQGFKLQEVVAAYRAMMAAKQTTKPAPADYIELLHLVKRDDVEGVRRALLSAVYEDIDQHQIVGDNALVVSCKRQNIEIMSLLVTAGASINQILSTGATLLMTAFEMDFPLGVALLLCADCNVEANDGKSNTALILAEIIEIASMSMDCGTLVNAASRFGQTALSCALAPKEQMREFLNACGLGIVHLVRVLVEAGFKTGLEDGDIRPLMIAVESDSKEVIEYLLTLGANVNAQNSRGETPLMHAAESGCVNALAALLAAGADINHKDYNGTNALMYAVLRNKHNAATFLLSRGADILLKDENNLTPFSYVFDYDKDKGNAVLCKAPLHYSAAALRRLLEDGVRDAAVWKELYGLLQEDMAMLIYSNPMATLSLSTSTGVSVSSKLSFHVTKEALVYVLRCVKEACTKYAATPVLPPPRDSNRRIDPMELIERMKTLILWQFYHYH